MRELGTINAVGNVLCDHIFEQYESQAEKFSQERFSAKLERPDSSHSIERRNDAWQEWIGSDSSLRPMGLYKPNWASARLIIARILSQFRLGSVSFTNGSEFIPTLGRNSIESKLSRSRWTCTADNFGMWVNTCYSHRGLKQAVRRRYAGLLASRSIEKKDSDRKLWFRYRKYHDYKKRIFGFKLFCVTELVHGNRFSTVPKNNLRDRPICVEPLANILSQKRIGDGIRFALQQHGIDLDDLATKHRVMISMRKYATIDLKNASDRISIHLVKYLLPSRVFNLIKQARSEMTLGLDDQFYLINKISSMGNGFTFELMSLILYALCRSYTSDTSVFGDDVIIPNEFAHCVISDMENAGFVVNMTKTHINSEYRESCGAHYIDGFGYIESYDFKYPKHMGDVITIINKLSRLAYLYPSFRSLYVKIYGNTPAALYAENPRKAMGVWRVKQEPFGSPKLDSFIVKSPFQYRKDGLPMKRRAREKLRLFCRHYQLDPTDASLHLGYEWKDAGSAISSVSPKRHWAKILMYLASGRRCVDTIKNKGAFKSFLVVTLNNGTTFRWSAIVAPYKESGGVYTQLR